MSLDSQTIEKIQRSGSSARDESSSVPISRSLSIELQGSGDAVEKRLFSLIQIGYTRDQAEEIVRTAPSPKSSSQEQSAAGSPSNRNLRRSSSSNMQTVSIVSRNFVFLFVVFSFSPLNRIPLSFQ
jgi:hypothetical protein